VTEWRNSTCQHSSVRSDTGLDVTFQALRILSYEKNYFARSRKMARENDDKQKEDKPPSEEVDTITRLVVRMQCSFCGVQKWRMIRYREKCRRVFVSRRVRNLPLSNCRYACVHSVKNHRPPVRYQRPLYRIYPFFCIAAKLGVPRWGKKRTSVLEIICSWEGGSDRKPEDVT